MSILKKLREVGQYLVDRGTFQRDYETREVKPGSNLSSFMDEDAEAMRNSQGFVNETLRAAQKTEEGLSGLQHQGAGQDTAGNRRNVLETLGAVQRQTLANAAENGWIRSRALDDARLMATRQQTLAMSALKAQEEQAIRTQLQGYQSELAASKNALLEIPESARTKGTGVRIPINEEQRANIEKSQRNSEQVLAALNQNRPSADQMRASFSSEVDKSLQLAQQAMVDDAIARGMPKSYVDAIPQRIAQERQAVGDEIERWVTVLSGSDPAAIQSELAALYNPEKINDLYQARVNPAWSLVTGLGGAVIGAAVTRTPAGAMYGYSLGSSLGTIAGNSLEG